MDISVSGFARFYVNYGDLDKKPGLVARQRFRSEPVSRFDFRNETEVHFLLRGRHDATGLEYGGAIELEADTNRTDNADETWIFLRGGFGELRFGDTDSAANTMKVGAYTVAVGSGGIDGVLVSQDELVVVDLSR